MSAKLGAGPAFSRAFPRRLWRTVSAVASASLSIETHTRRAPHARVIGRATVKEIRAVAEPSAPALAGHAPEFTDPSAARYFCRPGRSLNSASRLAPAMVARSVEWRRRRPISGLIRCYPHTGPERGRSLQVWMLSPGGVVVGHQNSVFQPPGGVVPHCRSWATRLSIADGLRRS
jgi:hypothetical protein